MSATGRFWTGILVVLGCLCVLPKSHSADDYAAFDSAADAAAEIARRKVQPGDWPQRGGSSHRNNTPSGKNIPTSWDLSTGMNVKWSAQPGSQTNGTPVIANGKVFVGTNNGAGYLQRYPSPVDLGVLLCFDESTGTFLWQHSNEKLASGRIHDWPQQGICSTAYVEGDRLWYVTNRGEVVCLDTEGFRDGENDGPFQEEQRHGAVDAPVAVWDERHEADVVWKFDMMRELDISQHNMCCSSITCAGDILFAHTANGVDESHTHLPKPDAPSFIALNRQTGAVIWTDNSPGENILHGQWSSPAYGVFQGVPQVLFGGGDGWLYSFDPLGNGHGKSKLLWKFDCNPKEAIWRLNGGMNRNHIVATPVIYAGLVYIGVGQDPEHGEGIGQLWCIDPTKRGDVSPERVYNLKDPKTPIPHKRYQACVKAEGDFTLPNPNSAAVWNYSTFDRNNNGKIEFEETMHRTCSTVAIKHDLLFAADFSGLFHCLNARTGKPYWVYDQFSACWSSPLIVEDHVFIGDEDGEISIFHLGQQELLLRGEPLTLESSLYATPVVANNVLFIATKDRLFAFKTGAQVDPKTFKSTAEASGLRTSDLRPMK